MEENNNEVVSSSEENINTEIAQPENSEQEISQEVQNNNTEVPQIEDTPSNNIEDNFVDDVEDYNLNSNLELHNNLEKCMDNIIKTSVDDTDLSNFGIDIETYKQAFQHGLIDRINDIASKKLE